MEIQSSMIHVCILSSYPIPASLESDIAQELSLSLNGALWEKLAQYIWDASDAYISYSLGNAAGIIEEKEANAISTSIAFIPWLHTLQTEPHYTGQFGWGLTPVFIFFFFSLYKLILFLPLAYFLSCNAKRMKPCEWEELHYCWIFFPQKCYLLERYHPSI